MVMPGHLASVYRQAEVLGTTNLLRSCVQPAVGMLRDDNEGSSRSTRRVEILLGLLSNEDDSKGACSWGSFLICLWVPGSLRGLSSCEHLCKGVFTS